MLRISGIFDDVTFADNRQAKAMHVGRLARWQQRCGLSLSLLQQLAIAIR